MDRFVRDMFRCSLVIFILLFIFCGGQTDREGIKLVSVQKIWDAAPHNAFTDLIRFHDRWFCAFREGNAHVSPHGALRVIQSRDGSAWDLAALLTSSEGDLRDAKLVVTPDDRLMLVGALAYTQPADVKHQTLAWFSNDGVKWDGPVPIGEKNMWMWRVTWHDSVCFGVGYATDGREFVRLYYSDNGRVFKTWVDTLFSKAKYGKGHPNEATLLFPSPDSCYCLLRRDADTKSTQIGIAVAPFREWIWKDLGVHLGGPNMIRLPDKRVVAAGRLYDNKRRTSLLWLDPANGSMHEFLTLPSGGDTSYPGLVWHDDMLWISYYSSHEGTTAIYLAKVKIR